MTKKDGKRFQKQSYKCLNCGHIFVNKSRKKRIGKKLWEEYCIKKQTIKQLSEKYNLDHKTVRKYIYKYKPERKEKIKPRKTTIGLDTTYFNDEDGLLVIRSLELKKSIYWRFIEKESYEEYKMAIEEILRQEWKVAAATCDMKRGIRQAIEYYGIPVQFCHFHQRKMVGTYITNYPKTLARKTLLDLTNNIKQYNQQGFKEQLEKWYRKWFKELTQDIKLKSAHRSLKTNLPYLFTYQNYPELNIQTTNNSLEGWFGNLKINLRVHRGLSKARRNIFIEEFLMK